MKWCPDKFRVQFRVQFQTNGTVVRFGDNRERSV